MSTRLDQILEATRATVDEARARTAFAELEKQAEAHQPRGWAAVLRSKASLGPAIIAEIKKASPSRGIIREAFDVRELAVQYEQAGAAALSVLTDEPFFQGSLGNLEVASAAVKLPCLRKDFIVDEYQIAEARAHSADAILLIAAALSASDLRRFVDCAHQFSLDVLVEVHTKAELDQVLDAIGPDGADAIGVNNRDLKTFDVRLETSLDLASQIPSSVIRVAESGIGSSEDIDLLQKAGFDAFLIGESLMRQPNPGAALKRLLAGYRVET
jgi:indole-3-glycerol phosphate synthase